MSASQHLLRPMFTASVVDKNTGLIFGVWPVIAIVCAGCHAYSTMRCIVHEHMCLVVGKQEVRSRRDWYIAHSSTSERGK